LQRFVDCIGQSLIDHAAIRAGRNLPKAVRGPGPEFEPFAEIMRLAEVDWHEAVWLAGITTAVGWDRPESIGQLYNTLYEGAPWTWSRVVPDGGSAMAEWIEDRAELLHQVAKFGDHRAYQSHRATAPTSTGRVVRSLVGWLVLSENQLRANGADFDQLYSAMEPVVGFGRTARYDFLRLLGLLGLAPLTPRKCYFEGSSGPQRGARRFFGKPLATCEDLETHTKRVGAALRLQPMILEDVLCQAQKVTPRSRVGAVESARVSRRGEPRARA